MLGEWLYAKLQDPWFEADEYVGKITGMLLEKETADILFDLQNAHALQQSVSTAKAVLFEHGIGALPIDTMRGRMESDSCTPQ